MDSGGETTQSPLNGGQAVGPVRQVIKGEAAVGGQVYALDIDKPAIRPSKKAHLHRALSVVLKNMTLDTTGGYIPASAKDQLVGLSQTVFPIVPDTSLEGEYIGTSVLESTGPDSEGVPYGKGICPAD